MNKRIPEHIGIIPDGNRRWAMQHHLAKSEGYRYGLEPGRQVIRMAKAQGIREISYYGFTVDNCKRPKEQVEAFSKACVEAVDILTSEGADILVLGDDKSQMFPTDLLKYIQRTSVNGGGIKVNLLVNYGWKWDLSHMGQDGTPYSSDISRIDMIIRWGGMRRLSGFLPIQSVYSDFYVVEHLWPDYEDQDFIDALSWYQQQDVTLGG